MKDITNPLINFDLVKAINTTVDCFSLLNQLIVANSSPRCFCLSSAAYAWS